MLFVLAVHALWHRAAMAEGGCPQMLCEFLQFMEYAQKISSERLTGTGLVCILLIYLV